VAFQCVAQVTCTQPVHASTGKHNDIESAKVLLVQAEALPDYPLDPVAADRCFSKPPGDGQAEARAIEAIRGGKDGQESIARTNVFLENTLKLDRPGKARTAGKGTLAHVHFGTDIRRSTERDPWHDGP